jgi:hypothetical protein
MSFLTASAGQQYRLVRDYTVTTASGYEEWKRGDFVGGNVVTTPKGDKLLQVTMHNGSYLKAMPEQYKSSAYIPMSLLRTFKDRGFFDRGLRSVRSVLGFTGISNNFFDIKNGF